MKKYFILPMVMLLSGCASWNLSYLNPWSDDGGNAVEEAAAAKTAKPRLVATVNQYLWQASLDKLAFMGFESTNPEEGVIRTLWKTMPEAANERFKIVAEINSRDLRADALNIKVYKEVVSGENRIKTAPSDGLQSEIEQLIIKQAKILYINDKNKE